MSKTFKENYYNEEGRDIKKLKKTHKQKRQRVKDYLRQIEKFGESEDIEDINNDFLEDINS